MAEARAAQSKPKAPKGVEVRVVDLYRGQGVVRVSNEGYDRLLPADGEPVEVDKKEAKVLLATGAVEKAE